MSFVSILAVALSLGQTKPADEAFFETKIRPVLLESCFKCHGGVKVSNELRIDSREALLKGGKQGPAIVPGQPAKSLLLQAMRHENDELRMPPGKKLPDHVLADFARWIEQGAPWPKTVAGNPGFQSQKHWAFQPVKNIMPPADPTGWAQHPIDRFILAKLREQGLKPVQPAERPALLRRVHFDLIGLPPSPEEMDAFVKDADDDAFAKVVERLLASPHHGERWGRHWMDVAHYADTAGDNADYPIPEIYRYRDFIINAVSADMPYDQFVQEQLAGDILAKQGPPEKYADRVVATGFLALNRRYATAPYELWYLSLEDAIDTTSQAFLGLTMRCARCHDHKFDPIVKEDYYGLYTIFANTAFPYTGSEEHASMKKPRQGFVPLDPKGGKDAPAAYAVQDGKPVEVKIHLQGDPDKPGALAGRRVPKFLEDSPVVFPTSGSGRLQLAQWIARPENPLTARVLVNRIWQHHFGQGLVGTPNNFGIRGEPPTHPELLDHLASEFVRHGWSMKWLHRYILQSKTYQLASTTTPELLAKDPDNRWLGRFSRQRLDAESLRDAMLWTSGRLDLKRPGPQPFPPISAWKWTQHNPFKEIYASDHRSVYLMTQRIQRHPFLALFDGPDTNTSTEKRNTSLVPLQALYSMNHPFVREQAEFFARRLLAQAPDQDRRIALAHQLAWGRAATELEVRNGRTYVGRYQEELKRSGEAAERLDLGAWTSYARVLLTASEFMFVD